MPEYLFNVLERKMNINPVNAMHRDALFQWVLVSSFPVGEGAVFFWGASNAPLGWEVPE